jgi:hypothetical protein
MNVPIGLKMGMTATLLVSVKKNAIYMRCFTGSFPLPVIVCKLAHEHEQRTLAHSGRVRTNLHDLL